MGAKVNNYKLLFSVVHTNGEEARIWDMKRKPPEIGFLGVWSKQTRLWGRGGSRVGVTEKFFPCVYIIQHILRRKLN